MVIPLVAVEYAPNHFIIKFATDANPQVVAGTVVTDFTRINALNLTYGISAFDSAYPYNPDLSQDDPFYTDGMNRTYIFKSTNTLDIPTIVAEYSGENVEWCEGDQYAEPTIYENGINTSRNSYQPYAFHKQPQSTLQPNDPEYYCQWYLKNSGNRPNYPPANPSYYEEQRNYTVGIDINAENGWNVTTGHPTWIVAICSNGLGLNYGPHDTRYHPDMDATKITQGYNATDYPQPYSQYATWEYWQNAGPQNMNGTLYAGLVAATANNSNYVAGTDWHCRIMPIKVWNTNPDDCIASWLSRGITWAAAPYVEEGYQNPGPAQVILVTNTYFSQDTNVLREAVGYALKKNSLVIAPAYHLQATLQTYPGAYPVVLNVGGIFSDGSSMCYDPEHRCPYLDVCAPVGNIWGLRRWVDTYGLGNYFDSSLYWWWEPSLSAAIVAGVASLTRCAHSDLDAEHLREWIKQSARDMGAPGWDARFGYGLVDLAAAVGPYNGNGVLERNKTKKEISISSVNLSPNPAKNSVLISLVFSGINAGNVSVKISDLSGRMIKIMEIPTNEQQQQICWDCVDNSGRAVANGVYIVAVSNSNSRLTKRLVVAK
jgi:hypothetical protein